MTARNYAICLSKEQIKILSSIIDYTKKVYFDRMLDGVQCVGYSYILKDQTKSNYTYRIAQKKDCIELNKYRRFFDEGLKLDIYPDGHILDLTDGIIDLKNEIVHPNGENY